MVYSYYIGNKHILNVLHIQLRSDYADITNVIRVESSVSELVGFWFQSINLFHFILHKETHTRSLAICALVRQLAGAHACPPANFSSNVLFAFQHLIKCICGLVSLYLVALHTISRRFFYFFSCFLLVQFVVAYILPRSNFKIHIQSVKYLPVCVCFFRSLNYSDFQCHTLLMKDCLNYFKPTNNNKKR